MSSLSNVLTANRVAAIAAFITGLASALAGLEGALPTSAANAVATAVGVLGSIATGLHFMSGAQKYDALVAGAVSSTPPENSPSDQVELSSTPELLAAPAVRLLRNDPSGAAPVAPEPVVPAAPGSPA